MTPSELWAEYRREKAALLASYQQRAKELAPAPESNPDDASWLLKKQLHRWPIDAERLGEEYRVG